MGKYKECKTEALKPFAKLISTKKSKKKKSFMAIYTLIFVDYANKNLKP